MNASYAWLKAFVSFEESPAQLRDLLTAHVATVDELLPLRESGREERDDRREVRRLQIASTSLPKFSPLKSLRRVSGKLSMLPFTTSSFAWSLPAAIQPAISFAASP